MRYSILLASTLFATLSHAAKCRKRLYVIFHADNHEYVSKETAQLPEACVFLVQYKDENVGKIPKIISITNHRGCRAKTYNDKDVCDSVDKYLSQVCGKKRGRDNWVVVYRDVTFGYCNDDDVLGVQAVRTFTNNQFEAELKKYKIADDDMYRHRSFFQENMDTIVVIVAVVTLCAVVVAVGMAAQKMTRQKSGVMATVSQSAAPTRVSSNDTMAGVTSIPRD